MKNRFVIYLPVIFALILIAGLYLGYRIAPVINLNPGFLQKNPDKYNKLNDIVNYIEREYVDSVSKKNLTEDGIAGILQNLDPHSQYISAEEFDEVNDPLIGNFEGIGIEFTVEKDTIIVIHTVSGGPSEKVGLLPGDRIVKVDDSLVAGISITSKEAMKKLKGKRGTVVKVSIFRRNLDNLLDFNIARDVIPTFSVDVAFTPKESIGYIRISKFSATTHDEFLSAIEKLEVQGMRNLILDLRENTGGYLETAIDIADEFLIEDKLIVYTEGNSQPKESFYSTGKGRLEDKGLVILIDENSASASEILAGAIQDNDRGLIVGRRSFGKGLVQRQLDFIDGSALRLTVARYYTPTGRCIQKPYIPGDGFGDYYSESYHRFLNGEMEEKDSIHFSDTLKYFTPMGKVVYGGGGIMPDIFVPIENDVKLNYFYSLTQNGLIFRFAFDYTDKNREELMRFTDFEQFSKQFQVSSVIFNELVEYAQENGIERDEQGINYGENQIKTLLKAQIGRNLYDEEGFYKIYLTIDNVYEKALESFEMNFTELRYKQ